MSTTDTARLRSLANDLADDLAEAPFEVTLRAETVAFIVEALRRLAELQEASR